MLVCQRHELNVVENRWKDVDPFSRPGDDMVVSAVKNQRWLLCLLRCFSMNHDAIQVIKRKIQEDRSGNHKVDAGSVRIREKSRAENNSGGH